MGPGSSFMRPTRVRSRGSLGPRPRPSARRSRR